MPEVDLLDVLRPPRHEVAGEAPRDEPDGGIVAAERVGARPRVVAGEPAAAPVAVLLLLLEQRGVDHVDLGDDRHEDRGGLGERELDGVLVDRLGRPGRDHGGEQGGGALLEREDPLGAVADVLRGHLGAVVELDAVPELERVGQAVGRDRVALGQPRVEDGRVVEPAIEAVVEVEPHRHAPDVEGRVRVHGVVGALVREDEAGLRHRRRHRRQRRDQGHRGQRERPAGPAARATGAPRACVSHGHPPTGGSFTATGNRRPPPSVA